MKTAPILLVVLLSFVCVSYCKDLIVGSSFNNRLIHQEKAEYNAFPLKKRVKEVFFSDPGQQIIKVTDTLIFLFYEKKPIISLNFRYCYNGS